MEKRKTSINVILIIIIILLLIIPATIYIIKSHYDSLYLVINKKVIEQASNCFNDNKCENRKIELKELIDKGYLDKIYDPVSKELISLNSYVDLENNEFIIIK